MKKSYIVILVVLLLLIAAAAGGYIVRKKLKAGNNFTTVRIETVERGTLTEFVSAPGEIEPKTKVEISAKVSARIVALPYDEGDRVTAGDPDADPCVPPSILVQLDSKDHESQLRSAVAAREAQAAQIEVENARIASQESTLHGLKASLEQAKRDLERQKQLLDTHDISQAAFDQARLNLDELKSQYQSAQYSLEAARLNLRVLEHNLEAAEARIEQAREALSYTTIKSPIDGIVTRLNAEVGEVVIYGTMNNPGTVIMEIADLSEMLVVAQVGEADVGKLDVNQPATIEVDAYPNHEFTGIVRNIALAHTLSPTRTKYFRTEILLTNVDRHLHEGLTAHVDIETEKHTDIIKVPTQAVLGRTYDSLPLEIRDNSPLVDKAKTYATVVYSYVDNKAVVTPVEIGASDLTHTIVKRGLKEGEKIITGPYKVLEGLRHDQSVKDERELQKEKDAGKTVGDGNDANDVDETKDANAPHDNN